MGLFRKNSDSSFDKPVRVIREKEIIYKTLPNPDPKNYKIFRDEQVGRFLLVAINYPDCENYEGNKILLFENCTLMQLERQKLVDPHFSNNIKYFSPIARFEPTVDGWDMALKFIKTLHDGEIKRNKKILSK